MLREFFASASLWTGVGALGRARKRRSFRQYFLRHANLLIFSVLKSPQPKIFIFASFHHFCYKISNKNSCNQHGFSTVAANIICAKTYRNCLVSWSNLDHTLLLDYIWRLCGFGPPGRETTRWRQRRFTASSCRWTSRPPTVPADARIRQS